MKVCSGVLLLYFVSKHFVWCNTQNRTEDARVGSILMPLVYLRNFGDSANNSPQIPFIFVPFVILPINVNTTFDFQDMVFQDNIFKINESLNINSQNESTVKNTHSEDDDIEVNFRQSLNRGAKVPKITETKSQDDLSKNNANKDADLVANATNIVNMTIFEGQTNTTGVQNENETQISSNNSNLYPPAHYDNKLLDSLSLTTLNEETKLPAMEDKRWEHFTANPNINVNKTSTSNNLTSLKRTANRSKGPYSVPLYNNAMIDQLSITTNSYTNLESSTAQNDRWTTFSTLGRAVLKPTGFKPLAGLYYDGFLHTPLIKMPGFNPHGDYNYP